MKEEQSKQNTGKKPGEDQANKTPAQQNPGQVFLQQLTTYEKPIVKLLVDQGMSAEKFMTVVGNAVRKTPKLLNCDRRTLFGAILTAAEFGLEPNTPAQLSYIIPYGTEAQFQIGYHGVVTMMYRNSRILKVSSEVVYENDDFDYFMDDGMNMRVTFKPNLNGVRGDIKGIFAVVHVKDAEPFFKYMSRDKLLEIKKCSKNPGMYEGKNDPEHWMYKKAVLKQVAKLVPKTEAVSNALSIDSMIDGGGSVIVDENGKVVYRKNNTGKPKITKDKLDQVFGNGVAEDIPYENVES